MSEQSGIPAAADGKAADVIAPTTASSNTAGSSSTAGAEPKKALPKQNPAFRMMGLPRLRLPSRNWMIFLSVTGSFTGAVIYDKWQTRLMREKWCNLVSHIANEPLDSKTAPRKLTIYLSAPPGDGLRSAREHFHTYIKPVLVSAAMDWDVVEGRKEGDVRHKTGERIRKRRRKNGEGTQPLPEEEETDSIQEIRRNNGDVDYPGVAGDIVVGRNTWKEYIRGIHEGYLGPADAPKSLEPEPPLESPPSRDSQGRPPLGDGSVTTTIDNVMQDVAGTSTDAPIDTASPTAGGDHSSDVPSEKPAEEASKEEKKPKRRFPPPYILQDEYPTATASRSTPEIIGPSVGVRMPHLLGIRNTPTRIYRFLTRRKLQDDVGRQVAAAILGSHRSYSTTTAVDETNASSDHSDVLEQMTVLRFEENDWWPKTIHRVREDHEESVWIEPLAFDERISSRMRTFEVTADDEDRAKRIESGVEKVEHLKKDDES